MWNRENFNVPIVGMYGQSALLNRNRKTVRNAKTKKFTESNYQKVSEGLSQKAYFGIKEDRLHNKKVVFAVCPICGLTIPTYCLISIRCPFCGMRMNLNCSSSWSRIK